MNTYEIVVDATQAPRATAATRDEALRVADALNRQDRQLHTIRPTRALVTA